ncbi:hypothetical protein [Actibacterium sp. MT2.3-13A]|uniref:hypothetical protein n=1 Tax=Actibacterium sp. MT2.3-13A TaxID=2828332 RepID=UPI001BA871A4|nr:hypothetical protein [Actibacterium sp. MT2.3-13A]
MSDTLKTPDIETDDRTAAAFEQGQERDRFALEVVFLAVLAVVVIAAFFEALTYDLVSSRTPFVIMVPLMGLIAFQAARMARSGMWGAVGGRIARVWSGNNPYFNKILVIMLCSVLLLGAVLVIGHYAAIFAFIFVLVRALARERLKLSLLVAAITTVVIFALFEVGFDIELYRGLIIRYLQGYRDF